MFLRLNTGGALRALPLSLAEDCTGAARKKALRGCRGIYVSEQAQFSCVLATRGEPVLPTLKPLCADHFESALP